MTSTVEIVPQADADLPQLLGLASGEFADRPGWDEQKVLEVLRRDVVFVAQERGQVAGFVALRRDEGDTVVIEQLLVATGHQQHGIGRRLLAHAEGYAIAEQARSLRIVVEQDNRLARSFYTRSGFVPLEPELFELVLPGRP